MARGKGVGANRRRRGPAVTLDQETMYRLGLQAAEEELAAIRPMIEEYERLLNRRRDLVEFLCAAHRIESSEEALAEYDA